MDESPYYTSEGIIVLKYNIAFGNSYSTYLNFKDLMKF